MANFNNWADGSKMGNYFAGASGYGSTETEEQRRKREYEEKYGTSPETGPSGGITMPTAPAVPAVPTAPVTDIVAPPTISQPPVAPAVPAAPTPQPNTPDLSSPQAALTQQQEQNKPQITSVAPTTAINPNAPVAGGNGTWDGQPQPTPAPAMPAQPVPAPAVPTPGAVTAPTMNQQPPAGPVPSGPPVQQPPAQPPSVANPPPVQQPPATGNAQPTGGYYDQKWYDVFNQAQTQPLAMAALANNPGAPDGIRKAAALQQFDAMTISRGLEQGKIDADRAKEDPNYLNKLMRQKNDEGSFGKFILYGLLGASGLAKEEATKLGIYGTTWQQGTDEKGDPVIYKLRGDGSVMYGADIKTGAQLSDKQLAGLTGQVGKNSVKPEISTQDVEKDGMAGRVVTVVKNGRTNTYVESGGKSYEYDASWKPRSISTTADKERAKNDVNYGPTTSGATGTSTGTTTGSTSTGDKQSSGATNNNPGNIMYGDTAIKMGATGKAANGTAIFPDAAAGDRAQDTLLSSPAYKNMNLHQIISKWAPNNENNPAQYARTVKGMLGGIDMDKTYNELTPDEKQIFRQAQFKMEHGANSPEVTQSTQTSGGIDKTTVGQGAKISMPAFKVVSPKENDLNLKESSKFDTDLSKAADDAHEMKTQAKEFKDLVQSNPNLVGRLVGNPLWRAYVNSRPEEKRERLKELSTTLGITDKKEIATIERMEQLEQSMVFAGKGAMSSQLVNSNVEQAMYQKSLPSVKQQYSSLIAGLDDIIKLADYKSDMRASFNRSVVEPGLRSKYTPGQFRDRYYEERGKHILGQQSSQGIDSNVKTLTNDQAGIDAWNGAPKGTIFVTPDGKRKIKP